MRLQDVILRDTRANQPAATAVPAGTLYYVTDESVTERSSGSAWQSVSDGGTVANDSITDAKLRNSGALSVIGRSANSTGDPADISAVAASGSVLRESGSTLGFGTIVAAGIASDAVITAKILNDNVTGAKLSAAARKRAFTFVIDGGGSAITTGAKKMYVPVPVACTILSWYLVADQSGSIVLDIWKDAIANHPPTVADTITAAAKPTLSTAIQNSSSTLTGWTTSLAAGDIIEINVDSITTVTKVTLTLVVEVTT